MIARLQVGMQLYLFLLPDLRDATLYHHGSVGEGCIEYIDGSVYVQS